MFSNVNINLWEDMMFENHHLRQEEAAHNRLVQEALQAGSQRRGFHKRALFVLGKGLVELGNRLRDRFDDSIIPPTAIPCEE